MHDLPLGQAPFAAEGGLGGVASEPGQRSAEPHSPGTAAGAFILDASAIINLLGSGDMPAVVRALGATCFVETRTLREIQRHPIPGLDHRPVLADLQREGRLTVERMSGLEYETNLSLVAGTLASRLGSGESAAIALAARGHALVLDENKARRIVAQSFPAVPFFSTLRLLLAAAQRASLPVEQVRQWVLSARVHARMGVPREEQSELEELMRGVEGWPAG